MLRPARRRWPRAFVAVAFLTLVGVFGCDKHHPSLAGIGSGDLPPGKVDDPCASHQTGCTCSEEGATVQCGSVKQKIDNYVICSEGFRTCTSGQWGDCVADHDEKMPLVYHAPMQGGYTAQALGSSTTCNNLCDPGCQKFTDDANGITVDVDLSASSDGVTLPGSPGGGGGATCNNMQLTPKTSTVTVTKIATDGTITATPNSGKIDVDAKCSDGSTTEPSWTLDSYDRATVSAHGVVTVYSGVAGPITVTGQGPTNSDTALVTVVDVIGDTPVAAGSSTEPGKTLYPYNNTLFPLGLKAPLVQWSEGSITPTQTQVMLCYPKNTCSAFQYVATWPSSSTSTTLKEPRDGTLDNTVPAWQIPQQIWSAFDRTAAGDTGQIVIRRQAGSTKYKQLSIDVQFATDALRGTVYYTQYLRTLHNSGTVGGESFTYNSSSYTPGQTCEVGNSTHPSSTAGSQTRAIDLSTSAATNIDPIAAGGKTAGCPVCHSISADGSTALSSSQGWQTSGSGTGLGVNSIGLNSSGVPAFTSLFAAPNYETVSTAQDSSTPLDTSRGFSYAALTPDGSIALQAPAFWGSTLSTPSANNTQNADATGVANQLLPYFFAKTKSPNPGFGVQFATTGPLPSYTVSGSGSSLTLAGSGGLTVDGYSMGSTSYSLLVKDETGSNAKYNGVYTVSSTSSWKLKVRSDAYSSTSFAAQTEVRVTDGSSNRGNVYYVSAPTSGTITPGSTAMTFSQRVYPPMVFASSARNADYATTSALPGTVTQSGNVLTTGTMGSLTVDGHTMAQGEILLVQDQAAASQNGTYTVTAAGAAGSGTPTTVPYATNGALPSNTDSGGVLTSTAPGTLPAIDGIVPAVGDTLLVKDESSAASNGIYTVTSLGLKGTGTTLGSVLCATTAALPANANSSSVLTGTAFGALPSPDTSCTLAVGSRLLVKNEAASQNNGVYTVTSLGLGNGTAHTAVKVGTTAALAANTASAGTITATNWGPIANIDGQTVAAGDRVLVMNEGTPANNGVYTVVSAGTPAGTQHTAVRLATTGSLPANTNTLGVLTPSVGGGLYIDGVAAAVGDRVLIKNEVNTANNGVYNVTTLGTGGPGAHAQVVAATTASLPAYTFASNALTSASPLGLSIDGVTFTGGERVLVKNEVSQQYNGIYTVTNPGGGISGGTTHTSAKYGTTQALPANSNASGTLTPSEFGALQIDGQNVATNDRVLVQDEAASQNNGIYTVVNPGTGSTTTASGGDVRYGTAGALPNHSTSSTTLQASSNGKLAIDGVNVATGDRVLIQDEGGGTSSANGIWTVSSAGASNSRWRLNRAGDALSVGLQVTVSNGNTNAGKTFYLSTPASGTVNAGSTAIAFTQSVKWSLQRATDAATTGQLKPGDLVTVTSGPTNGGQVFYVSQPASGSIVINVTGITFSPAASWVLTRATDADTTGDFLPGDQVPVTGGSVNANVTYYLSSPTTTPVTINTSALSFSAAAKWSLTRATDTIAPNDMFPVTAGGTNANTTYYVSTPPSGLVVLNVTGLGFSLASKWSLTRAADADANGDINPGDMVPVTSGTSNGGKTFYVSTPASGSIVINTTAMGFSLASKWTLARATDADQSSELVPGLQVPVTSGGTNGGKTYYISTPASGTITVNSTGIAFTQELPWQLTRKTPYTSAGAGLVPGLEVTVSSGSTNANKTYFISSPSSGTITVDATAIVFTLGTSWQLTRTSDADANGEITPGMEVNVANGATNGGRVFYVSSPTNGTIAINSTGITFSYGLPSMMAPVISPDGKKIAYVNGDADVDGGLTETGWRRGLTMFSFDQSTMTLSSKKRLINNWNATTPGTAVKWPFFEGDSRSLIYVETSPNEFCSSAANNGQCGTVTNDSDPASVTCPGSGSTLVDTNIERACYQAAYGSMSPTTRGYWPGRLYSIDTQATTPSSTRVELATLDNAEDTTDAGKAYQPTVLPFTAGGKRWVIFTSPRAYGNQFNQKGPTGTPTDLSCAASMLWVAALDNTTANGSDRSHQAFFMPGQQVAKITASTHYVNERGYLVPSPCKATGTSCSVDEECCGATSTPATAACRVPTTWDPSTGAPAKSCQALSGTCSTSGQSCSTASDCCGGASCVNFTCSAAGKQYTAATFTREYVASCATGQLPLWELYSYHLSTPDDSSLVFSAQTSDDLSTLDAATVVSLGSSTDDVASPVASDSIDVGAALDAAKVSKNLTYMRILVKLVPATSGLSAPTLKDWSMTYTCVDSL